MEVAEIRLQGIAYEATKDLFVNGQGEIAERLVLVTSECCDLGSWGFSSVRNRILEALHKAVTQGYDEANIKEDAKAN